jgi:hypothetical protein
MKTKTKRMMAAAAALAAPMALAATPDPWDAPFTIQIGALNVEAETRMRLDTNGGRIGTEVSFEGDLGGEDSKTLPTLDLLFRFNPRHAIEASVYSLRRDGQRTLTGSIDWGDVTFPVSTVIDSSFDSDVVRMAYRWSPIHDDRGELGLLLGVHYTRLEARISSSGGSVSDEASVKYPLPTLGIVGTARLGDNWRLAGYGHYLKLEIDEYDGELINFGGGIEWMFSRGMFAGLGYDYYEYNLTSTKENARGRFDYVFEGPKLYFGWNFR